jgi:hypothetical protein
MFLVRKLCAYILKTPRRKDLGSPGLDHHSAVLIAVSCSTPSPQWVSPEVKHLAVTLELQGLEALEFQMARNLEALRERQEAARFASTFKGRLFNFAGRIFTVYCTIRVISVCQCPLFKGASNDLIHARLYTDHLQHRFPAPPFVNIVPRHHRRLAGVRPSALFCDGDRKR